MVLLIEGVHSAYRFKSSTHFYTKKLQKGFSKTQYNVFELLSNYDWIIKEIAGKRNRPLHPELQNLKTIKPKSSLTSKVKIYFL